MARATEPCCSENFFFFFFFAQLEVLAYAAWLGWKLDLLPGMLKSYLLRSETPSTAGGEREGEGIDLCKIFGKLKSVFFSLFEI